MAAENILQRRVAPASGAPAVMADRASFGAQLASDVGQAVETLNREQLEDYEIERRRDASEQWSGFQRGFIEAREQMATVSREARRTAGAGHAEEMGKRWQKLREPLLQGITDEEVLRRANAAFDDYGGRIGMQEADFEEVRRIENVLGDWAETETIAANRMRRMESHEDYLAELTIGEEALRAMDLPEPQLEQALRNWHQVGSIAFIRGVIDRDPHLAKAMLSDDAGLFDDVLEPNQVEVLLNGSETEIRALEVQARAEQAQQREDVRERSRTAIARSRNAGLVDDEEFATLIVEAQAIGDTSLVEDLTQAMADNVFVREYDGAPPLLLEQDINRLQQVANRSEDQERQLRWLQGNIGSRQAQFDRDPAGFLISAGGAPAFDPEDPQSFAERARWAAAQSRATGRYVPPLSEAEAEPFRDLLRRDGQMQVLQALDNFADPLSRVDAAQAIAPENHLLHRLAVMNPAVRANALTGAEALNANPQLLKPVEDTSEGAERMASWQLQLAQALRAISPEDSAAVWQSARLLMASNLAAEPGATVDTLNEAFFRSAVQLAMGATPYRDAQGTRRYRGGLATWGGSHFVVAGQLTAQEWGSAARADYRRQQGAGTGPVNPDGSAIALDDLRPVWLGGNFYAWEDRAGRRARNKDGEPFIMAIGGER